MGRDKLNTEPSPALYVLPGGQNESEA